ncbi:MAG: hypothetical protein HZA02_11035 [Nitrospinae bacterium]|nr:hypothetical protein [Nitrospinota bacterium]
MNREASFAGKDRSRPDAETDFAAMMDAAPVGIMFADRDLVLRYINRTAFDRLRRLEPYLREKAERTLGKPLDSFHRDPWLLRKILSDPRNLPYKTRIHVGPEVFDLFVSPVFEAGRGYLGPMVLWEAATEKLELQRKVSEFLCREKEMTEDMRRAAEALLSELGKWREET